MPSSNRLAWLEERRKGLGGSDIAKVAGLSPYGSAWSVYWDKVNPATDDDVSEAARWGQLLEDGVADEWALRTGRHIMRPAALINPDEPWMRGHPDRLIAGPSGPRVLEVKLAGEWAWLTQWDGGAQVPAWYRAQGQWYARLAGADRVEFAVLVGGRHLATSTDYPALGEERNDRAIAQLVDLGRRFWHDHVLAGQPPAPDHLASTREALDELYPAPPDREPVVLADLVSDDFDADSGPVLELITRYREARHRVKVAQQQQDAAANGLRQFLGQHKATDLYLTEDAPPLATYRPNRRVDVEALLRDAGEHGLDLDVIRAEALTEQWSVEGLERACGKQYVNRYRIVDPTRRTLRVPEPREE